MKCLLKYKWVKLYRYQIPDLRGIMGSYLKLAAHAAFRKGNHRYCGYENFVEPGTWSGGVVGLKSILGVKKRRQALLIMNRLQALGYIRYTLDSKTKKLTYRITHWVLECSGEACMDGVPHATDGYGFICMPRGITDNLLENGMVFDDSAAWLDLWCHTVYQDYGNAYSFLAPAVQFGKYGSVLTLDKLGKRWGWEKTKVWRFLRKHQETFRLYRLPSSYGCVIFNCDYPTGEEITVPEEENVIRITELIRISARNTHTEGSENQRINRFVAWKSRRVMLKLREECAKNESGLNLHFLDESGAEQTSPNSNECRVADPDPYTRAYISHGRNCKYGRNCMTAPECKLLGETKLVENVTVGTLYTFFRLSPFLDDS